METENMEKNCSTPIKYLMKPPTQLYSPIKNIATTSTNSTESPFKCASFSTPPTKFFRVRNPFDAALANRLHLPISSPSVFKKMPTPVKTEFQWSIDELSSLNPVHIEEYNSNQFDQPEDPEIERTAQQNIEKESKQIVPSPWDEIPRKQIILPKDSTPMRAGLKNAVDVEKRDNACQTILSLPPILPPEVEQVLRPFFTFTEDQQQLCNNINENLMNASLCRRLFHFSSEDESIDSTNSSVKSGDLPPFQSPKLNESGKHHDKSFEHRKCMTLKSPSLSPVQRISSSNSDELLLSHHKEKANNSINQKMSLIHQSTPTPSPQSYKSLLSEKETLEESPLSPITKPSHENSMNNKIQSSSPLMEHEMATATTSNAVSNTNANTSRRSIKRLDFSDEMMSVDYAVPDSENLPDQSINMMGTSILINDEEIDCTYSSVNWDIENKSISNIRQDKRIVLENDNVVKSIFNKFETTPSKRHYQRTLLKKYSDNFDERDKENIAPRSTLLRRCFSSDMTCDCGGRNDIRCRFHYFNKYRVNNSFASATTDDSDIRDRSLLDNDRNTSPNSYLSENTQDTGYNSNVIGGSSSTTSLTNIFMANTNLVESGGRTMSPSSLDVNNEWQSSIRIE